MKNTVKNQTQGNSTSDRAFHSTKQDKKKTGISNSGGQQSDQTSNSNTDKGSKQKSRD
ncbi:hypothetical protein [Hufsiella arboris]|uniref:hypothetical protein n=1 Tax=Hufsiella arboris TaxID=2695275 RepID=UPI0019285194|nr:hypothetical protein [Hufsiella arboris]